LEMKAILKKIDAQIVYTVHTENAELFIKFMRDIRGKIIHTEKAKEYKI